MKTPRSFFIKLFQGNITEDPGGTRGGGGRENCFTRYQNITKLLSLKLCRDRQIGK